MNEVNKVTDLQESKIVCWKSTAEVYKFREKGSLGIWADITIESWAGGGSIKIVSDYGDYAKIWGSIGVISFKEFLISLDFQYFMKKTRPKDYEVFDPEKTNEEIIKVLLSYRLEGSISKKEAREIYDDIRWEDLYNISDETLFFERIPDSFIDTLYGGGYEYVPNVSQYNCECEGFWERVWTPFKSILEKELNNI